MTSIHPRLTEALREHYLLERELGHGGMATVYLAHDLRHDRKVALKVLRPELSAILGAQGFEVTGLKPLLTAAGYPNDRFHQSYDVLPGGKGLVFRRPWGVDPGAAGPTVVEAENWLADVQARTRR